MFENAKIRFFYKSYKFYLSHPHLIDFRTTQYLILRDCGQSNESNEFDSHSHARPCLTDRRAPSESCGLSAHKCGAMAKIWQSQAYAIEGEKRCRPRNGSLHLDWYRQPARGMAAVEIEDYSSSLASSSYALSRACWTSVGTCWYSA